MYQFAAHQRFGKFMMDCNSHLGLFYDAGCGKTAIALWWLRDALKDGRIADALVICPASLVLSWERAIDDMIKFEGFDEHDVKLLKEALTIVSFQKTYKRINGNKRIIPLRDEVDKRWGAVIVDESHGIGSHSSVQSKAAIAIGRNADYRYALSGTPTHGGGGGADFSKLYGQMQFLTAGMMWKNWTDFCSKCVVSYDNWRKPRKYNEELCKAIMENNSIVCKLEDCFDMPEVLENDVLCPLYAREAYNDLREGRLEKYGLDIEVSGAQYLKMLQVCSGAMKVPIQVPKRLPGMVAAKVYEVGDLDKVPKDGDGEELGNIMELGTSKDDALRDILEGTDDQVVIFCNFRASIDRCLEICKRCHRNVQVFDGRSKGSTWTDLVNGKCNTLICQYQSGGVGLNLQTAHIMVMYEPCLSSLLMKQAKARIYRKGQDKRCLYHYLRTPGTIESKVWTSVRNGVDVNELMLAQWALHPDDLDSTY